MDTAEKILYKVISVEVKETIPKRHLLTYGHENVTHRISDSI